MMRKAKLKDRRTGKRIPIREDVVINRSIKGEGLDISEKGMYIYTRAGFLPESIIELSFSIEGEPVTVSAIVHHSQPGIGMGVQFIELGRENSEKIKRFVLSLEKGTP